MMPLEHDLGEQHTDVREMGRLAYQPDIYQRYSFLRGLTRGFLRDDGRVSVLDVGCGPVRITEIFLGSGFDVIRADVEPFDSADMHVIDPGRPLPFDSAAFDLVVALEVVEHVGASERPAFIRELQRVSRLATIVCCPVATPETVAAERRFSEWAVAISGRDVDFLVEHRERGLPDVADVVSWFATPAHLLVADNAPLDDWLAFNLIDLIYAADFGDTVHKQRFDTAVNSRAPLQRAGAPHYRRFFCAIGDPVAADAARRFILESTSTARQSHELISVVMSEVVDLRDAIRARFGADLATKDAAVALLTSQSDQLSQAIGSLQASLTEHQAQIAARDGDIAKLRADVERLDGQVSVLQMDLAGKTLQITEKDGAIAELMGQVGELERSVAAQQSSLDDKEIELAARQSRLQEKQAELDDALGKLRIILESRSWQITAPARALGRSARRAAELARRFAKGSA